MTQPLLLLIDDSPEVRMIVRHLARRAGTAITTCIDAEQGWSQVQTQRPDLILLDIHLPGANGCDFCRWLRAHPLLADVPVALLSHWQRSEDIAAGLRAGADFVLSKDLLGRPEEWQRRLREILSGLAGRCPPDSLAWQDTFPDVRRLTERFNRMMRGAIGEQLGPEVVRIVLERSLRPAQVRPSGVLLSCPQTAPHWLTADGLALDADRWAAEAAPDDMRTFLTLCADQTWCLLGTAARASFWAALQADALALCEYSSSR